MEDSKDLQLQKREEDIFLQRKDCCFDCVILNVILGFLFGVFLLCWVKLGSPYYAWYAIFAYIFYVCEVLYSNTYSFMFHSMKYSSAIDRIAAITRSNPTFTWTIECYHYETRVKTIKKRDSHGNTYFSTETTNVKIITSNYSTRLEYKSCQDTSKAQDCLEHLPILEFCRIYLHKKYTFADNGSQQIYEEQKNQFIINNKRDVHFEFKEKFDIPQYLGRICTFGGNTENNGMPWRYHPALFVFLSVFFMGWIIRILLYLNSFAAEVWIEKQIRF